MTYGKIYPGASKHALTAAYAAKPKPKPERKPKVKGGRRGRAPGRWDIEGEKLTTVEIIARCPRVNPGTIRNRLTKGKRTWAALRQSPEQAQRAAQAKGRSIAVNHIRRDAIVQSERRKFIARKTAAHQQIEG